LLTPDDPCELEFWVGENLARNQLPRAAEPKQTDLESRHVHLLPPRLAPWLGRWRPDHLKILQDSDVLHPFFNDEE
jgi:hypothetical protein